MEATGRLVKWAIGNDRRLIFTSSDLVFDGTRSWYREDDPSRPILEYGRMKRAAELAVAASSNSLTVRVSLLYGKAPSGREGFFDRAVSSMRAGTPCAILRRRASHSARLCDGRGRSREIGRIEPLGTDPPRRPGAPQPVRADAPSRRLTGHRLRPGAHNQPASTSHGRAPASGRLARYDPAPGSVSEPDDSAHRNRARIVRSLIPAHRSMIAPMLWQVRGWRRCAAQGGRGLLRSREVTNASRRRIHD